jgi:mono/diheme cytochrome c family protein
MFRRTTLTLWFSLIAVATMYAQAIKHVPVRSTPPDCGKCMFSEYCVVCHGTTARGDGPAALALVRRPTDLTQLTRQNGGRFPGAHVVRFIRGSDETHTFGTRDMPVWSDVLRSIDQNAYLTEIRIAHLEQYIASLQER